MTKQELENWILKCAAGAIVLCCTWAVFIAAADFMRAAWAALVTGAMVALSLLLAHWWDLAWTWWRYGRHAKREILADRDVRLVTPKARVVDADVSQPAKPRTRVTR